MAEPASGSANPTPAEQAEPGPAEQASISYEAARDELVQIVQRLESGGAPLDESLALWERGEALATICQQWLDGAQAKIEAARPAAISD